MRSPQPLPFRTLLRQGVGFKHRPGNQRGDDPHQHILSDTQLPKRPQTQTALSRMPARQGHSSAAAKKADFAQFVIAKVCPQPLAKGTSESVQPLARALTGGIVADSNIERIARIIAIGNDVIWISDLLDKPVQQIVLLERLMQPKKRR